jgi:hypothetical protein
MNNDTPLKWNLKLTVELAPGESVEHDVTEWKRGGEMIRVLLLWNDAPDGGI